MVRPMYYTIIAAELLSDLGNQFVQLTLLDILILKENNAGSNLLTMYFLELAPSIFLSSFAGLWIDRIGAKNWLIIINLAKCAIIGMFIYCSSLWVILLIYLGHIICSLFFNIGRLTLSPIIISEDKLISFNALIERISLGGRVLGPFPIGWVILNTNHKIAFGIAGILFMLSTCSLFGLTVFGQVFQQEDEGYKHIKNQRSILSNFYAPFKVNPYLKSYFAFFGVILMGGGIINFGFPLFFKTHVGENIADWGIVLSGFQAGSCVATFLLPRFSNIFRQQTLIFSTFFIIGGSIAILCQLTTYIQMVLLMVPLGFGFTLMHIYIESHIQKNTPKSLLGKTISVLSVYKGVCYLGTIFGSAFIVKLSSPKSLLLVGSLVMLSASFIIKRFS
ncbi:MAG: MFS transporter [Desulfobacterales bacterium]